MWADASGTGEVQAVADWGDNLMSHTFNTHTPLRIEVALYGPTEMSGFDMPYVIGSGMDEMQGSTGRSSRCCRRSTRRARGS
ncbi:MAG TPA: hypothetical protein VK849_10870 [Longimicrobiales bacterium]|nr:hypothetical protein [Longimicrobiales bacterium]